MGENLKSKAHRVAAMLRERLSDEEFADLRHLLGDTTTDMWLCQELAAQPHERGGAMDEVQRQKLATEHRERERRETVQCQHCGTSGLWTRSGVIGPWGRDDGTRLTEFSTTTKWDGTHEMGPDHTPKRCLAVLTKKRDELIATIDAVTAIALSG